MKFKELYPMFDEDTNICVYDGCDRCINDNYSFPPKWIDDLEVESVTALDCNTVKIQLAYCYNLVALENLEEMISDFKGKIYDCKNPDSVNDEIIIALHNISDTVEDTLKALDMGEPWDYYLD